MPSQADMQRIVKFIVEPWRRNYGAVSPDLVDDLADDLAEYSDQILTDAWRNVRRTRVSKPTIAVIREECEKLASKAKPIDQFDKGKLIFVQRETEALNLYNDWLSRFFKSGIYADAQRGCYELELWKFATAVAWFQAAKIAGLEQTEARWNDIFGWDRFGEDSVTDSEKRGFLAAQREQIATGKVDVSYPCGLIQKWQKKHIGDTPWHNTQFLEGSFQFNLKKFAASKKSYPAQQKTQERRGYWYEAD